MLRIDDTGFLLACHVEPLRLTSFETCLPYIRALECCASYQIHEVRILCCIAGAVNVAAARTQVNRRCTFYTFSDSVAYLCRYRKGPQPKDYDGERALDFVLDNDTLQDFNRTLLFDIKLLTVRKRS